MNTAELNVAVSTATLLNMSQIAVDVARLLQGRITKEELQARSAFALLDGKGTISNEFIAEDGMAADPESSTFREVNVNDNEESTVPYQIATDLMARQVTTLVKFK